MCIVHWTIFCGLICCVIGYEDLSDYSIIYRWNKENCDFKINDITQYERRLIIWDGIVFKNWCNLGFRGENSANVATSYKVCLKIMDYNIKDCKTVVVYSGFHSTNQDKTFSCNDRIPDTWCVDEMAALKIDTTKINEWHWGTDKKQTDSYLTVEVYAVAAVNLSIAACLGIVGGIFVVIAIIGAICAYRYRQGKSTEGEVISTDPISSEPNPTSSEPNATGHDLTANPNTMEVMQPCEKETYRPQNVMAQPSAQLPPSGATQTNQVLVIENRTSGSTPSEGRVISTDPNSSQPNEAGRVLIGYPQKMKVMLPYGKGRYRPRNVFAQQSIQLQRPGAAQPNQLVFQGDQTAAYTPSAPLMSDTS